MCADRSIPTSECRHSTLTPSAAFTQQQFSKLDSDGNGRIDRGELVKAFETAGFPLRTAEAWANQVLHEYDIKGDDGLDLDEFAHYVNGRYLLLHKAFHELDASRTGDISEGDVHHALRIAGVSHLKVDVDQLLARLGGTKGRVTFEEFFEASLVLPSWSGRELLLTQAGVLPIMRPPPGTTATMIVTAGFINGAVSRTLTAPFDRLRAVLATGRETSVLSAATNMYKAQGVRGFWASNMANVVQVGPENAIAFCLNETFKEYLCGDTQAPTVPEKFLIGSAAGAVAMTAVYPMYVVQNRLAAALPGQYNGMLDCVGQTMRGGAYAGFGVSLLRVMPLKGIMLGGYSTFKDLVKDPETGSISTTKSLACSAAAGGLAHAVTYPLHLARTVLMQEVAPGGTKYKNFVDVLKQRVKTHGIRGCYAGLPIWLCNRIPAVAIEFAVNERALDALRMLGKELS